MINYSVLYNQFLEYAKNYSEEVCALIVDGNLVIVENSASHPETGFYIKDIPDGTEVILHSHPGGPFYPSELDMQQQIATDVPWVIAAFDDEKAEVFMFGVDTDAPLVGRGFRHGVTDCYELIRDFYSRNHAISLLNVPRDWEWWASKSLYNDLFENAGFRKISNEDILPGDCFLATIRSKTPNHAGIYIGNGLILHHTCGRHGYEPTRLSTVEPAMRWFNFLDKVVRYEKSDIDRTVGQGIWKNVQS